MQLTSATLLKYYGTDWLAMFLTMIAIYKIGNRQRFGFIFMTSANACWLIVGDLPPFGRYYFAVKTVDASENSSALSNVVSAVTDTGLFIKSDEYMLNDSTPYNSTLIPADFNGDYEAFSTACSFYHTAWYGVDLNLPVAFMLKRPPAIRAKSSGPDAVS